MIDESQHAAGSGQAAPGPWHDVADALGHLGASISRATTEVVADDENRRRMRELSEGLTVLAGRLAEAAGDALDLPVARIADRAAAAIDEPLSEAATAVSAEVEKLRPAALDALRIANEKFRAAGAEGDAAPAAAAAAPSPFVPAPAPAPVAAETLDHPASITGRFAAVVADKVGSLVDTVATAVGARQEAEPEVEEPTIQEWLFPESVPEAELQIDTEIEPGPDALEVVASAPLVAVEPAEEAPVAAPPREPAAHAADESECADAVRVAHERFVAERKIAEEAAGAALTRARAEHPKPKRRRPAPSDDDATLW